MDTLIAVPSSPPGGLEAQVGAHFGHCELYTLVTVKDGEIADVRVIPNVPHEMGGCLAPVAHLAGQGVDKLIAGGMGMRPLMGFHENGIAVYHGNGAASVGEAIAAMLAGKLPEFSRDRTCGGSAGPGGCGHH